MKIIFFSFVILLSGALPVFPKEPTWLQKMRQVRLLKDSYGDVLNMLGKPSDGSSEPELSEYFDTKDGRYFALFASGLCVVTDYSNGEKN